MSDSIEKASSTSSGDRLDGDAARREQAKGRRSTLKWQVGDALSPIATLSDNTVFETVILVIILLNAIWIGVDLELNNTENLFIVADSFELFSFVESIFCMIFSFEIVVRVLAYRLPHYFFLDEFMWHWNAFDLVLVAMMVVEVWILQSPGTPFDVEFHKAAHLDPTMNEEGLSALSSFRMFRLLRLSRMVRMIRAVPELFMMVKSMLAAFRGVASTLLLMAMLLYVFSIVFTVWGRDATDELMIACFGNLGDTYQTFIAVLVYDDAFAIIRPVFYQDYFMGSLMILFMVLGSFTVLNMLIGVIVEIVGATQEREGDHLLLGKIAEVFDGMDTNNNGALSKVEFAEGMDLLETVGVSRETCILAVDILEDDSVDLNEFVDLVFKLLRPIQSQDVIQASAALQKLCEFHGVKTGAIVPNLEKANNAAKAPDTDQHGAEEDAVPAIEIGAGTEGEELSFSQAAALSPLLRTTGCGQALAKNKWFHMFILFVIVLNAAWIGIELEANDPTTDYGNGLLGVSEGDGFFQKLLHGWSGYELVEQIFLVIFMFEIVVRVLAYINPLSFFTDPDMWRWNVFDLVLVGLMFFENVIVKFLTTDSNLKMLSILRLLRLTRLTRLVRSSPEMQTMIKSLAAALRSVGSTMALLLGLLYVGAIVMTQWGQDEADCPAGSVLGDDNCGLGMNTDLFGGIFLSMMTLLQLLIFDDAMEVVRAVTYRSKFLGVFLLLFMLGGAFTVLNMLIGVIVEIVNKTKRNEEERLMREKCVEVFKEFDVDNSGTLTREEFMDNQELVQQIGLDSATCRIAFDLRDTDGSGVLTLDEFMSMCLKLTKPPQAHDILVIKSNMARLAKALGATAAIRLGSLKRDSSSESAKSVSESHEGSSDGATTDSASESEGGGRAFWAIEAGALPGSPLNAGRRRPASSSSASQSGSRSTKADDPAKEERMK